ncbi:hypothetical protein [Streptomyces sp. MJM1172]|uniref:hypothetical protein n=1 Tax=Streptomyces sp. MJM1172 TaxID=1703926 RepID=UPI00093FF6F7|nr:hypothetical protein [Streptomyces sp. MJM1172]OKI45745.1 hypothetical protein AMK15_36060 [Streptomyces sp. MJM1172]
MQINRRKTPWYVRVPRHLNQAVGWSVSPTVNADDTATEFAQRNARFIDSMPDEEQYARVVTLHTVRDGRSLTAELTPAEAQDLGQTLVDRAAFVRLANVETDSGFTSDRDAMKTAIDAHKLAQNAVIERGSELIRMVWGELKCGGFGARNLIATDEEFGSWYIWIADDGATALIEASNVPGPAWGAFVSAAIDRRWFQAGAWGGAEKWATAKPSGEYLAQSHRAEHSDVLELDEQLQATKLHLRAVDTRKVARGLLAMLTAESEA